MDEDYPFAIGKGAVVREGKDVTIIGTGTVFSKAYEATALLREKNIDARLINMHTIKPIDRTLIIRAAEETKKIVTVEEHYLAGGLGSTVAEVLCAEHPVPVKMIGVNDQYASNGPYEELLGLYGLQSEQIAQTVERFLG